MSFKQLLLVSSFVLCIKLNAQTTAIPDANFEQRLIDLMIDTNGLNGNILDSDAQAVTNLTLTGSTITNFTGLEAFVNVVNLNLGNNSFATVPLSNLTLLETLKINERRYFYSDVHVRGEVPSYTQKYWERNNYNIEISEEEKAVLKEGTVDYIGFSYYMSGTVSTDMTIEGIPNKDFKGTQMVRNPYIESSDWGWPIDPVGLRYILNTVYQRYNVPLFIVENGFGAYDQLDENNFIKDDYRIDYLSKHIEQMELAIVEDGVDVIGYTPWGIIDIVSFGSGEMEKRYGMIYVDKDNKGEGTLKRSKKMSFDWYKNVIATNGAEL